MSKKKSKKTKRRQLGPRRKRMKRAARLKSAEHWLVKYDGKNVLRGYRNHFGVDWRCAAKELALLGVKLNPEYIRQLEATEKTKASKKTAQLGPKQDSTGYHTWHEHTSALEAYLDGDFAALHAFECERDGVDPTSSI